MSHVKPAQLMQLAPADAGLILVIDVLPPIHLLHALLCDGNVLEDFPFGPCLGSVHGPWHPSLLQS